MTKNSCEKKKYQYYVTFWTHELYECYAYSENELTKMSAEGFAWGVIRSILEKNGIPLDGYATNIKVFDTKNEECIFERDVMEISSSDEMIKNVKY